MPKNGPHSQPRLVFWQNMISIHQVPLLRALALRTEVVLVVDHEIEATRRSTGWTVPDTNGITVIVSPGRKQIASLCASPDQSVHLVSGFGAYSCAKRALRALRRRPNHHALIVGVEPWDPRGVKGALRRIVYTFHVKRWQHNLDLLITTGRNAYRQFESIGVPATRLAPFAYFSDAPSVELSPPKRNAAWTFAYVGRLEPLKNVDSAIRALSESQHHDWALDIVGDGTQREQLESLVGELGVSQRVRFHGMLSNHATLARMSSWDVLILPSAYDGWGYVVNEAIVHGLRCIVSDAAGAHDVISASPTLGRVFRSKLGGDLANCISLELRSRRPTNEDRHSVARLAMKRIGADAGADYVLQLCDYALQNRPLMPAAPWEV